MRRRENDCYTRLTVEIQYLDNQKQVWMVEKNAWDMNGEDLAEMFRSTLLAMGYHPTTVTEIFNEEAAEDVDDAPKSIE
jgi:hypothetical protein